MLFKKRLALVFTSLGAAIASFVASPSIANVKNSSALDVCNYDSGTYVYYSIGYNSDENQTITQSWNRLGDSNCSTLGQSKNARGWALRAYLCPRKEVNESPVFRDCRLIIFGNTKLCTSPANTNSFKLNARSQFVTTVAGGGCSRKTAELQGHQYISRSNAAITKVFVEEGKLHYQTETETEASTRRRNSSYSKTVIPIDSPINIINIPALLNRSGVEVTQQPK